MAQALNGRRGANFTVRLTEEERAALLAAMVQSPGPRDLGAWMVWKALDGAPPRKTQLSLAGLVKRAEPPPARAGGALPELPVERRRILDLCGGSGSWSAPYRERGYPVELVTLPEHDVRMYVVDYARGPIWGVLAAPPCEQFSLARNGHVDLPRDLVRGMETVNACLRIIHQVQPRWWALENPAGLLSHFLGTPRDLWEPYEFGDPWSKRTCIWGSYALPKRGPFVAAQWGGGPACAEGHGDPENRASPTCSNAACRAKTPPGFARAFCEANA